jgi:hypothetical protein
MVRQGLPCFAYPEALAMNVVLPLLPAWHRNLNRFPFRPRVIGWGLRIGLLLADERCQETRVLFGVQNSHLDLLLLTPGYALLTRSMRPFGRTSALAARPPTRSPTQSALLGLGN